MMDYRSCGNPFLLNIPSVGCMVDLRGPFESSLCGLAWLQTAVAMSKSSVTVDLRGPCTMLLSLSGCGAMLLSLSGCGLWNNVVSDCGTMLLSLSDWGSAR